MQVIIVTAFIRASLCLCVSLRFTCYFHLSTNSVPNTAPPYTVICPFLFYNSFVTQNEIKSGPFKVSFFSLQCLKYWVKSKIYQNRRINPKSYERFFFEKKRPITVNLYEDERIFTKPGGSQDIPYGGV